MVEKLQGATDAYLQAWQAFCKLRRNRAFFDSLHPTAVGWKTASVAEFDQCFEALRGHADQIHLGWINERWVAALHLKDVVLPGSVTIVKLMQRRPDSTDAVGIDHLDFRFDRETYDARGVLSKEPDLHWTKERNGDFSNWLSIWFDKTEAKVRSDTILDVCIREMEQVKPGPA